MIRYKGGPSYLVSRTQKNTVIRNRWWPTYVCNSGDEKIVGLYAVWPDRSNWFSFNMVVTGSTYTVDFGDGNSVTNNTNVATHYTYNYNNVALDGTNAPVTLTTGTNLVTRTNHLLRNNEEIILYNITTTSSINSFTCYYVVNVTANTFQLSLTKGGTPVTIDVNGTASILPYKIAVVTITPNAISNVIATFPVQHSVPSTQDKARANGWLDVTIALSRMTNMTLGSTGTTLSWASDCEFVRWLDAGSVLTSSMTGSLFANLGSLKTISTNANTANSITFNNTFQNCRSLVETPFFNTSNSAAFQSMFQNCFSLKKIPKYDYAKATSVGSLFSGCYSIETVPDFNFTGALVTCNSFMSRCYKIREVPAWGNTASVATFASTFTDCYNLEKVADMNCANTWNFNSLFVNCSALQKSPKYLGSVGVANNTVSMYNSCHALEESEYVNTSNVTDMNSMYNACYNLKIIGELDLNKATSLTSTLLNTYRLEGFSVKGATGNNILSFSNFAASSGIRTIPAINLAASTSITYAQKRLDRIQAYGANVTFSLSGCNLSNTALNEVFTNLSSTGTGKTITITGNQGASTCNTAIATAKGWTVTA